MASRHVADDLAAFAERQLDPSDAARVEAHLRGCARCREALDEVRRGIALAAELRREPMPADAADRIRARLLEARVPAASAYGWRRLAAAAVLALAAVALYWQLNRPWARLVEGAAVPPPFEQGGREVHELLKTGRLRVAHATADERDVWRWLGEQHAPVTSLRPQRSPAERERFVPIGAAVREVAGVRTSVIAYEIDGRPVTLMLADSDEVPDAPAPGWWSKRVRHRRDAAGVNTLTWTVGGGTYVMVSELERYGQRACFICHTDERFRAPIESLTIR